jgi:PAP2 superfamily.
LAQTESAGYCAGAIRRSSSRAAHALPLRNTALHFITGFGNAAVLTPLTFAIAVWLFAARRSRLALAWLLAVGLAGGVTAALKIYFSGCGLAPLQVHSPSGHTAFSTVVWGGLGLLIGRRSSLTRVGARLAALLLVGLIAWSRLALGAHTPAEVIAGLLIGGLALAAFAHFLVRDPPPPVPAWPLLLAAALIVILVYAHPWSLEPFWDALGARWFGHGILCNSAG